MGDARDTSKAAAAAVKTALVDALEDGKREAQAAVSGLERGLERGLVKADAALASPEGADLAKLLDATDLPELPTEGGPGALGKLGVRLDREADLYRNIALRELSRVAWMDRLTLIVVLIAFVGEAAVAACATAASVVGVASGGGGLLALAALVLAGAAGGVARVMGQSGKLHRDLANEALVRSRTIEDELFRLAIVMEWRATEPPLFQDALARLERRAERAGESLQ